MEVYPLRGEGEMGWEEEPCEERLGGGGAAFGM